jgi:hypothetical protein
MRFQRDSPETESVEIEYVSPMRKTAALGGSSTELQRRRGT